jgi:hypothetical protein
MDMNTSRTALLNDLHYMVSRRDRPANRVLTDMHKKTENGKTMWQDRIVDLCVLLGYTLHHCHSAKRRLT